MPVSPTGALTMMTRSGTLIVFAATTVLGTQCLAAQEAGNPAGMAPDTPKTEVAQPPPDFPNTVDQLFARQAFIGGQAEVDLGKLAGERAQSDAVKQFARRMVDDHSKANDRLAKLGKANRAALPKGPDADPDARAVRSQLEKLRGADFDAAYMAAQVGDHQKTAQLLEHEIGSGQDVKAKEFAKETLPTVMRHLEMARAIQAQLAGVPPPG
jgi:putative membrane protein